MLTYDDFEHPIYLKRGVFSFLFSRKKGGFLCSFLLTFTIFRVFYLGIYYYFWVVSKNIN